VAITPKRQEIVDFSDPFLTASQALLARSDTPLAAVTTVGEIRPFVLGGQRGGAGMACIRTVIRPQRPPKEYDSPFATGQALAGGEVDGVVFPAPVAMALSRQFRPTIVVGQFRAPEQYGIVFDKGSSLRPPVNKVLSAMRADGSRKQLVDKWFPGIEDLRQL